MRVTKQFVELTRFLWSNYSFVQVFFFPYQQRICEREQSKGRRLLTTLAGLFVSNSDEDIKIDITALEDGWKITGSHFMVGKMLI